MIWLMTNKLSDPNRDCRIAAYQFFRRQIISDMIIYSY
jgi:hypothetical protein